MSPDGIGEALAAVLAFRAAERPAKLLFGARDQRQPTMRRSVIDA
jgi:hypothetical protein